MIKLLPLTLLLCLSTGLANAQSDSLVFKNISDQILLKGKCYEDLRILCKQVGHRLSGSVGAEKAIAWGKKTMQEAGADTVWLQPVWVPHWVRGRESLSVTLKAGSKPISIPMLSLGNAIGSGGKTITAPLLVVSSIDALKAIPDAQVKGKIVFFNYAFRQDFVTTFHAYGDAIKYRSTAPSLASAKGAVAVIIRSLSTGVDDAPHTGAMRYADTVKKIPAIAIGNTTAEAIALDANSASTASIMTSAEMRDSVLSYNVIGEIRGLSKPEEFVICGGHLDSWDVGEGAQDDGAGCVQAIEVIRTFKQLGIKPERTLRAVLFMNEENGTRGGKAYADSARTRKEKHIFAMESDAGGYSPRGVGLEMKEETKEKVRQWAPLFVPLNVYDFSQEEGGVDISPLAKQNVPLAGLLPDPQRYFDMHHSRNDVFEDVSHRELKLGAAVMTGMMYLVTKYGL